MAFLNNINQLRSVEFGKKFLWDIKLMDTKWNGSGMTIKPLPKPFSEFFPAQDVDYNSGNADSYQFEAFMNSYKIPQKSSIKTVSLTFIDDSAYLLYNFFNDWINKEIYNDMEYTSTLIESVKLIQILKLNNNHDTVEDNSLWVFPDGGINFNGSSASDPHSYTINLNVAGES